MVFHAIKIRQVETDVYVTVMKASELLRYAEIDWWTPQNPYGYQRPLSDRQVAKAAHYLLFEDKIFPTSILVNVRGPVEFTPAHSIGGFGEYGMLEIPRQSLPLYIVDGQHRIASIRLAAQEKPEYYNYPVVVSLLNLPDRFEEMRLFYIINSRQTKISTALAQRHLKQTIDRKGVEEVRISEPKRKILAAIAVEIVDILNTDPDSPWFDKVLLPHTRGRRGYVISQTSLADSIGRLLARLPPGDVDLNNVKYVSKKIARILINYWNAIKTFFPEAFAIPEDYTLQKTAGCYVFHLLFPEIYKMCKKANNFTKEYMQDILLKTFNNLSKTYGLRMTSEFWNRWTGHPLVTGSGMKNINKLVELLTNALPIHI